MEECTNFEMWMQTMCFLCVPCSTHIFFFFLRNVFQNGRQHQHAKASCWIARHNKRKNSGTSISTQMSIETKKIFEKRTKKWVHYWVGQQLDGVLSCLLWCVCVQMMMDRGMAEIEHRTREGCVDIQMFFHDSKEMETKSVCGGVGLLVLVMF